MALFRIHTESNPTARRGAYSALFVAVALLSACGGGGGSTEIVIPVQPIPGTATPGGSFTFRVAASGTGLSYQWQSSADKGVTWIDIGGATASEYLIQLVSFLLNGYQYRARISDGSTTTYSDPATLTVACPALAARSSGAALYDGCLKVTWIADANLAASQKFGVTGIDTAGTMTWPVAKAWVQALNTSRYLGYSDWRLPTVKPQNGTSLQLNGSTLEYNTGALDLGFNVSAPGTKYAGSMTSELPFLFYNELGGLADFTAQGVARSDAVNLNKPFSNVSTENYWTGTSYGSDGAFIFNFAHGNQNAYVATAAGWRFHVLALRDGDIGAP